MLRTIERISASEARRNFKDYIVQQKPVIIRDLYPSETLLQIDSPQKMADELGEIEITIGSNYYDKFLMDEADRPKIKDYVIKISKYISIAEQIPEMNLLCREQIMPAEVAKHFKIPDLIQVLSEPNPRQMIYVGNDQTVAPLHFDGDLREVLFTQIVGKKEIYLIEPGFAARLNPIKNFCGIPVHHLSDHERKNFFAFNDAFHCVLEPQETLYIPKLWWHFLKNIGITMAASVRFGTSPHSKMLQTLPFNYLTQNINRALLDPITGTVKDEAILDKLMSANTSVYSSEQERMESVLKVLKEVYGTLCPSAVQLPYLSNWFENEIQKNPKKFQLMYGFSKTKDQ